MAPRRISALPSTSSATRVIAGCRITLAAPRETLSNLTDNRFPEKTGASLVHERNLRHRRANGWIAHAVSSGFNVACDLPPEDGIGFGFYRKVVPAK